MSYKEGYADAVELAYDLLEEFLDTYAEDLTAEMRKEILSIQTQIVNAKNA